jgi:hypothetical protein
MAKLTPADEKFIAKFLNFDGRIDFNAEKIIRSNRFTGETFEVDPVSAAAIDFVFKVEGAFHNEAALKRICPALTVGNAVQSFDRARMIVLKMNSRVYSGILD